jgi:hypothetical protein
MHTLSLSLAIRPPVISPPSRSVTEPLLTLSTSAPVSAPAELKTSFNVTRPRRPGNYKGDVPSWLQPGPSGPIAAHYRAEWPRHTCTTHFHFTAECHKNTEIERKTRAKTAIDTYIYRSLLIQQFVMHAYYGSRMTNTLGQLTVAIVDMANDKKFTHLYSRQQWLVH